MDIIQSDVAIIGAGGSGLRAAIEIARSAPNAKISLISKVYPMPYGRGRRRLGRRGARR